MHRKTTGRSPANTFQIKGKFSTLWPPNYEMPGRTFFSSHSRYDCKDMEMEKEKRKMCLLVCTIRFNVTEKNNEI